MSTIVVVAAHPDDEVIGCAGTIARHSAAGDLVHVIFMADGEQSRTDTEHRLNDRKRAAAAAAKVLGVKSIHFLDFPDNAMDSLPFLTIVQALERQLLPLSPHVIYTHFGGDLNIDHRLTYQAVLTACRPQPSSSVRKICCFEIASSTEWSARQEAPFQPNLFIDISTVQDQVGAALQCYDKELRVWPHSRSAQAIAARQQWRGSSVGLPSAEAFMIERELL